MNLQDSLHIARKEILSTFRDRRTLVSSLLIPLLILPVVMLGLPLLLGGIFEREQVTITEVAVTGLAFLPDDLKDTLEAQNLMFVETDQLRSSVEGGDYVVALEVPDNLREKLSQGERAKLIVYKKEGSLRSELNAEKIDDAVDSYARTLVARTLDEAGLDEAILTPIDLETVDASTEAERSSGQLAWLIPFFIAIWTLAGGQAVALDATAGEKERGTLEALLVAPVARLNIVLGKFLATLVFGLMAAFMAILGYVLGGTVLRAMFAPQLGGDASEIVSIMGGSLTVTPLGVGLLLVSALLLAAVVAAVLICIAMLARTYKEAQTYIAPLSFLLIIPAVGLQFAEFFAGNLLIYMIPVLNVLVLMDDIVKAKAAPLSVLITWGTLVAVCALLLDIAHRNFKREGVLFRT